MKSAKVLSFPLLLLAFGVYAGVQAAPPQASVEDEIKSLEQRANAAYEANDLPKYFAFYAADFTQFLPEGRSDLAQYQKDWSAYIGEGNQVQKVVLSDMHIQVGPGQDTAVASYLIHVRSKLKDGKITEEDNQESDVFFKRQGEWKIVFLHYSAAPKK